MNEKEFLMWLFERFGLSAEGPGDDCALLEGGLCVTTDSIVEGKEFESGTGGFWVGYKAAAVSFSDLAAMGASAEALLCAAVLSPQYRLEAAELVRGLNAACSLVGARLVGGDYATTSGPTVLVTTAIGHARHPVTRSGARVGMVVGVTGALGGSILGKHLRFRPRVQEGMVLARLGAAAMLDISDGLLLDASRIAGASGVGIVLYAERIPISAAARTLAAKTGRTPLHHALSDGEDFELLFCAERDVFEKARGLINPLFLIGEVVEEGLWLQKGKKRWRVEPEGYVHGQD